jgi:heme exporter protein CcmD
LRREHPAVSFLADKYAIYVLAAYGATAVILVWLTWSSLAANAKARRDLAEIEKERGR